MAGEGEGEEERENGGQATSSQKRDPVGAPFTWACISLAKT